MKIRLLLILFSMLCINKAFSQNITSPEEQTQIKQVITEEAKYFYNKNLEKWSTFYRQTPQTYWAIAEKDFSGQAETWDKILQLVGNHFSQNPKAIKATFKRENYTFRKVNPTYIWVTFDQTRSTDNKKFTSKELRIVELIKGEWKIVNRTGFSINSENLK
ncbi:hypothetical protein [Arcicella rigui]|uniref:DUF4440 domain-containing protein n=1 Tax=Arcicella rigui TaxID=797020 RepID=A0ABU5QEU0_9BACT|nr:hypothetical protein [Arcicella rigui]MEA5141380.1 hypothetical protein [Arcicella rigui]